MRNPAIESDRGEATVDDAGQGIEIAIADGLALHHREHAGGGAGDPKAGI